MVAGARTATSIALLGNGITFPSALRHRDQASKWRSGELQSEGVTWGDGCALGVQWMNICS